MEKKKYEKNLEEMTTEISFGSKGKQLFHFALFHSKEEHFNKLGHLLLVALTGALYWR